MNEAGSQLLTDEEYTIVVTVISQEGHCGFSQSRSVTGC